MRELQTLCINGYSALDLESHCIQKWGLSLPNARLYIKEALGGIVDSLTETDQQKIALIIFHRYENAYKLARSLKNPGAMIMACDSMARYFLKKAPDADIVANQATREAATHDPREDFE